jgi:hypothetical protein
VIAAWAIRAVERRQWLVALLLLAAVVAWFFGPLFAGDTYQDIASRENEVYPWAALHRPFANTLHYDQGDQLYPWQVFASRSLRAGELPLWNPNSFAGQPFFATASYSLAYPPRFVLSLLVPPERVHDGLIILHVLGSGIAMYLLLATAPLSFPAALYGALVWMVSSFALGWLPFDVFFQAVAMLLPLALLLVHRMLERRSWRASLGLTVALALMFLGSNFAACLLAGVVLAAYTVALLLPRWWATRGAPLAVSARAGAADVALFAPLLLAPALALVQLLPIAELIPTVQRAALPYPEYVALRVPLQHLLYFFISPPFSFASSYAEQGIVHDAVFGNLPYQALDLAPIVDPYHSLLFVGTPTALLALVGLASRGPLPNFARWLAVVVILIVVGTPVTWLAYMFLPGASVLKPLGRFLIFFDFAAAILAAHGVDTLLRWLSRPRPASPVRLPPLRYGLLGLLALIALVQLRHVGDRVTRHQPDDPTLLQPATPLVLALRAQQPARVLPISVDDALVPFPHDRIFYGASALTVGLPSGSGYEVLLPERIANLWRVAGEGASPEGVVAEPLYWSYAPALAASHVRYDLLARLGVSHVVTPPDIDRDPAWTPALLQAAGLVPVYEGIDGRVYRVGAALPTAYLVAACEQVDGPAAALARFADPAFDPTHAVLIERAYADAECVGAAGAAGPGRANVVARSLNTLTLQVEAPEDSWLVISESWDAGWQAAVDGVGTRVIPGDYAFRALRVPAGTHTVEMRYQPLSFVVGAVVSGLAWLALAVLVGWWLLRTSGRPFWRGRLPVPARSDRGA